MGNIGTIRNYILNLILIIISAATNCTYAYASSNLTNNITTHTPTRLYYNASVDRTSAILYVVDDDGIIVDSQITIILDGRLAGSANDENELREPINQISLFCYDKMYAGILGWNNTSYGANGKLAIHPALGDSGTTYSIKLYRNDTNISVIPTSWDGSNWTSDGIVVCGCLHLVHILCGRVF